jgi:uncharacterized protein with von Willebrand factor type A (vWA) domain
VPFELVEELRELGQALCATVAGGCGHAEALEELFELLFELVEDLRELGQALSATVADGRGHTEARNSQRRSRSVPALLVIAIGSRP